MTTKRNLNASLMRALASGRPMLDPAINQLRLVDEAGGTLSSWCLDDLSQADLGYAFERLVGLDLEGRGYTVDYRGLRLKMLDGGIDLIAVSPGGKVCFYQCKATRQNIGPQEIEHILYKAGNFISKKTFVPPCELVLAVVNQVAISSKAFERWNRHNSLQDRVKLRIEKYHW